MTADLILSTIPVRPCVKCGGVMRNLYGKCTPCSHLWGAKSRAKTIANSSNLAEVKECKTCKTSARYPDGKCKECVRARVAAYRLKNPEKVKARFDEWVSRNLDKIKADDIVRSAAYRANNPEKRKATVAKYQKENKQKVADSNKRWKKNNPDAVRLQSHTRRAILVKTGGVLSRGLPAKLFKLQKGTCPCCHQPLGDDYHLDHKMPLALGGTNTDDNMQLLRKTCNLEKSMKHPIDFMQSRGFLL